MNLQFEEDSRRWGIDLIGGLYVASTLYLLITYHHPSSIVVGCVKGMLLPIFAIGVGLLARVGIARTILAGLLWVTLIFGALNCVYSSAQLLGLANGTEGIPAQQALVRTALQISITWWMLSYLRRPDVVAEFS